MNAFLLLMQKDARTIWRSRSTLIGTFSFSLLLAVVASFSFLDLGFGERELKILTPGVLWLIFLFSGVVGLNHTFSAEQENDALQGLLLTEVDPALLYLSKCVTNFLFIFTLQLFVLIVHGLLFGVAMFSIFPQLVFITALAGIGFVALGTLLSAIAVCTRGRELLLPLILFPLLLPLIAGAVFLTRELLLTGELALGSIWMMLICGFDIIVLVLSLVLFEYTVRD